MNPYERCANPCETGCSECADAPTGCENCGNGQDPLTFVDADDEGVKFCSRECQIDFADKAAAEAGWVAEDLSTKPGPRVGEVW